MKILKLVVHKQAFELLCTNEKNEEYRVSSTWMKSRLYDKFYKRRQYDAVLFIHGYQKNAPRVMREFKGFEYLKTPLHISYSNGLILFLPIGTIKINLGAIL